MDTDVSEVERKKRNRGRRRPFIPPLKRLRKSGRRGGANGRSRVLKRLGKSFSIEGSNSVAPIPLSSLEDPSVVDLTFSDEDTLELPPGSYMVEVVDTDTCAKVSVILVLALDNGLEASSSEIPTRTVLCKKKKCRQESVSGPRRRSHRV